MLSVLKDTKSLPDTERVRLGAVADTVANLHDDLEAGGGVSGQAARRAIKAVATAPCFAGMAVTKGHRHHRTALPRTNEDAMIYDNPHVLFLCHRDGVKDIPILDHCVPGCGNFIRTDQHALQLRERATAWIPRIEQDYKQVKHELG